MTDQKEPKKKDRSVALDAFFDGLEKNTRERGSTRLASYEVAAAVLVYFDPTILQPAVGRRSKEDDALVAELLDDCRSVRVTASMSMQSLADNPRRQIFRRTGIEKLRTALKANRYPRSDYAQAALADFLNGHRIEIAEKSYADLRSIAKVAGWVRDTIRDNTPGLLPSITDIRQALEHAALIDGFEELAGPHFQGRQRELMALRDYIGVQDPQDMFEKVARGTREVLGMHQKDPLVISGPGGIGKSTLLARVLLEHVRALKTFRFPFVYVDFDRVDVLANEPLTILSEAARQVGNQYPEAQGAANDLRQRIREELNNTSFAPDEASSIDAEIGAIKLSRDARPFIRSLDRLLDEAKLTNKPFVLILDTFERVQYQGSDVVRDLWQFFDSLGDVVKRLRVIVAGRAPVHGLPVQELPLRDFDRDAAIAFLGYLTRARPSVGPDLLQEIYTQIGGNPLSLRLAANVVQAEGLEASELDGIGASRLLRVFIREEKIQGQLYHRILGHIKHPEIRKLAHPGLILRRIDPAVILEVLAVPCGVKVRTREDAEALLMEFKKEVSLVSEDSDGSLRHRPEIRQAMLDDLRETGGEKIDYVQRRAVRFYSRLSDGEADAECMNVFRAEEIYHRLSLGQSAATIQCRWIDGLEQRLAPGLDELPAAGRAFLAEKLGRELDSEAWEAADLEVWEQSVARIAMRKLHRGEAQRVLDLLQERQERSEASPLFLLEARALLARSGPLDLDKARSTVERGLQAAANAANADALTDLLLIKAEIADRSGDQAEQHEALREAFDLAKRRNDSIATLRAGVELEWLADVGEGEPNENKWELRQELIRAFDGLSRKEVVANPKTSRRLAVLVGEKQPQVLDRVLRSVGLGSLNTHELEKFAMQLQSHVGALKAVSPFLEEISAVTNALLEKETIPIDEWSATGRSLLKRTSKNLAELLTSSAIGTAVLPAVFTFFENTLDEDDPPEA